MNEENKKMITVQKAGEMLGVSPDTVRRMVKRGELKQANKRNPNLKKQKVLLRESDVEKLVPKPEK